MQENPTTCPKCGASSPEEIIAVGEHRACNRCGWRSEGFDKVTFPPSDFFLDLIKDLQHFGPFGSPEYHEQLDLRIRVQQFRARWATPTAAWKPERPKAPAETSTVLPSPQATATKPNPQTAAPAPPQPANRSKKRGRRPDVLLAFRRKIIREVSATGVTGPAYAKALDEKRLLPPRQWIFSEGCPRSYSDAYRDKDWQHRINDEKSKYSE